MSEIIGQGGSTDRYAIPLGTKRGSQVPNQRRDEAPPARLRAAIEVHRRQFPHAVLRSISATYNCVGMVFATRRTNVEPEEIHRFLEEDGYKRLSSRDELRVGDVVLYGAGGRVEHVGIVVEHNALGGLRIMSKWGADGEYVHDVAHVPAVYGNPIAFWTDRSEP